MRKTFYSFIAHIENHPQKALGFFFGLVLPLAVAGIYWAQADGGLAGPLVDPRPPAFVVLTD